MTSSNHLHPSWTPAPGDSGLAAAEAAVLRAFADFRTGPVAPTRSPIETLDRVGGIDLTRGIGLEAAVDEAAELMERGDLTSSSARCFGYFNPTAAWPAVMADMLAAARNPQVCVTSHAPASTAMERHVIELALRRLGFAAGSHGNFTSGGSEANGTGLLVALVRAEAGYSERGVAAFGAKGRPCLYASADSHLAWIKLARAAGLGTDAVRLVPTDGKGRMDLGALERAVERDVGEGWCPVLLVATAGTTNAGIVDPLAGCRALADAHGMHLHVDAAWAGALIFDAVRRHHLEGIELADSVTIDAHKWLSVTMGAGMVFVKDRAAVHSAFAVSTGYMPEGDGADAYTTTQQWSRRFLGLRLWMVLRAGGEESYGAVFAEQFRLGDRLRRELPERGFVVRNETELPVVLFEDSDGGLDSAALADALESDGQVWLGRVEFEGRTCLRACVTSFLSGDADIDLLLERLEVVRSVVRGG